MGEIELGSGGEGPDLSVGTDSAAPVTPNPNGSGAVFVATTSNQDSLSIFEQFLIQLNQSTARLLAGATVGESDILDALRILGMATGAERIHLFRHVHGNAAQGFCEQQYEWVSDPRYSLADRPELRKIPWAGEGEPMRVRLAAGEAVFVRVDALVDASLRIPGRMGNKSTLLLPIEPRGRLWGHLALNSLEVVREWSQAEMAALTIVAGAFGSAIDRMNLEHQLSQSLAENIVRSQRAEGKYRLLTESMKDVLWVYDLGLNKFTYASPSVEVISGFTPEEVRELSLEEVVADEYAEMINELIEDHYARFIESGAAQGEYITIEMDLRHKQGGTVPVEAVVRFQRDSVSGRVEVVGAARDTSERQRILQALATSEEHYRLIAENSMDVVLKLDRNAAVLWVSPSLHDALGWLPEEWAHVNIEDYLHPDDLDCFADARARVILGQPTVVRFRIRTYTGAYSWIEVHAKRYEVAGRDEVGAVASFRIVDSEVKTEQDLERRARFDELTGVFNRHELLEGLSMLKGEVTRSGSLSAIMYVDVDNLKEVNDAYGHCTGDLLLQAVASRVGSALRTSDMIGRIGGDEFLILLRGVHGESDAMAVAEKVRESVAAPLSTPAGELAPSVSVGIAMFTGEQDHETMIARADDALRHAKGTGRNQVVII